MLSFSSELDSDDEIVWPLSSGSDSSLTSSAEDDYVVLSRPQSLTSDFSKLSLTDKPPRGKRLPERSPVVAAPVPPRGNNNRNGKGGGRKNRRNNKAITPTGLGQRPIVDDVSERASVADDELTTPSPYEEAVTFITSFLTNPNTRDSAARLTFLQALIIELGLATTCIPGSLNSAKAVLRSRAFVNIREYLAVRSQGFQAIQGIMYPSRSALVKDIKRKKDRASLHWVKQSGLQVLLVTCYH